MRTTMLMGACMLRSTAWIKGLMALSAMSRGSFQDCDKDKGWRLSADSSDANRDITEAK